MIMIVQILVLLHHAVLSAEAYGCDGVKGNAMHTSCAAKTAMDLLVAHSVLAPLQENQSWGVRVSNFSFSDFLKTLPADDTQRERRMAELGSAMKQMIRAYRFVVFSDQGDLTPAEHALVTSTLGPLEDRFNKHHSQGRTQEADPWSKLPSPVWPISNNPVVGTRHAGDGGMHADGHWFGAHWRFTSFFVRKSLPGGNTWVLSSPEYLAVHPEVKEWGRRVFIQYRGKITYPNGNVLAPSNSSRVCPIVTHVDGEWTMACFLDPKYMDKASMQHIEGTGTRGQWPVDLIEIERFEANLTSKAFEMEWRTGDLSFLDNWKLLHKATPGCMKHFHDDGASDGKHEEVASLERVVHRITVFPEGDSDLGCVTI